MLQIGAGLVLVGLLVGLAVPRFTVPRLALSTYLLGLMQGTFLMVAGVLWPRLRLKVAASRAGSIAAIYGCIAAWVANFAGAAWGAGGTMVPLAAGAARGTALQEGVIRALLMSAAPCLIATAALLLWGLRGSPEPE
jgi:hydroxylaminobenzene mutase